MTVLYNHGYTFLFSYKDCGAVLVYEISCLFDTIGTECFTLSDTTKKSCSMFLSIFCNLYSEESS